MLLRRITEHVKAQNWFAVGLDFLIVVVGVFVGLQVSNWNEARNSDRKEVGYLQRLNEDVISSRLALKSDFEAAKRQYTEQDLMVRVLNSCQLALEDKTQFDHGLRWLGKFNPPRFVDRTYRELTSTGDLNLISNDDVKRALAEIVGELELRTAVTETIYRRVEPHILLVEGYIEYDLPHRFAPDTGSAVDAVAIEYPFEDMCGDKSVGRAISAISAMTFQRAQTLPPLIEKFRVLESKIDDELGQLRSESAKAELDVD